VRANTLRNTFLAQSDYSFSRSLGFRADYSYYVSRFGSVSLNSVGDLPVTFFNVTMHTVGTGPTYTFTDGSRLFARYNYTSAESSGGGSTTPFAAHTFQPEYVTELLPGYTLTIGAGGTLVEQAGNRTFFSGKIGLGTRVDRPTHLGVSVSRQVAPGTFLTGSALISNVAQVSLSHSFSRVVRLTVLGNYAYNESTPVDSFKFTSYTASARLEYKVTRSSAVTLSQEFSRYSYTGVTPFDRYATILGLTTSWK
jgi:hypothetical protein